MKHDLANLDAAELARLVEELALKEYAYKDMMSHTPSTEAQLMDAYGDQADGYHDRLIKIVWDVSSRQKEILPSFFHCFHMIIRMCVCTQRMHL